MSNPKPLLSVCMITYNQAEYIEEALRSVLDQVCDFEFEVVVSNDSSSDQTASKIRNVIEIHPNGGKVKYFNHPTTLGMMRNFTFTLQNCAGKYVAMCEGDDYWTDPYKLQKQVDYLEANPDFSLCYHPVNILYPDGRLERDYTFESLMDKSESNIYDMAVLGNYIHTPSVVFRNVFRTYPETMKESPLGDYFLWMLIAERGKIGKLDEVMAVYRSGVGIHSSQSHLKRINYFKKTLDVLSHTISDPTIVEILRNRIAAIKSSSLPAPVRALGDFAGVDKAEVLMDFVGMGQLFKAIWLKVKRRF